MSIVSRLTVSLALAILAAELYGDPPSPAARTASNEDSEWDQLRFTATVAPSTEVTQSHDRAAQSALRNSQAVRFRSVAEKSREFQQKYPQHPKLAEARKLEVLMLINAVQCGDASIEGRADEAALKFVADPEVPEAHRAEIAGVNAFTKLNRRRLSGEELRTALENTARSLILSFPNQPQGYESLLTVAQQSSPEREHALLQELLSRPAPSHVQAAARVVYDRGQLIGKPLSDLLTDVGAVDLKAALQAGRPTLIFTWASWSPGSFEFGRDLAKRSRGNANVVALCLDGDGAEEKESRGKSEFSGAIHRDARGINGSLARALKVSGAPQVYWVDSAGVIRDVRGAENLDQKISQYGF